MLVSEVKPRGIHKGENNPKWVGDKVGYQGLHGWIRRKLGTPSLCAHCGTTEARKFEWANISGKYMRDVKDFIRLCTSCHRKLDMTDEKRENIRKVKLGNTYRRESVVAIDENGVTYSFISIKQASEELNILRSSISNCLTRRSKKAGGYMWKYGDKSC